MVPLHSEASRRSCAPSRGYPFRGKALSSRTSRFSYSTMRSGCRSQGAAKRGCTINTEIKAKRNNMISKLISFRITKAKAKAKFWVKCLCKYQRERSSVPVSIHTKAKANNIFGGNYFHFSFRGNVARRGCLKTFNERAQMSANAGKRNFRPAPKYTPVGNSYLPILYPFKLIP